MPRRSHLLAESEVPFLNQATPSGAKLWPYFGRCSSGNAYHTAPTADKEKLPPQYLQKLPIYTTQAPLYVNPVANKIAEALDEGKGESGTTNARLTACPRFAHQVVWGEPAKHRLLLVHILLCRHKAIYDGVEFLLGHRAVDRQEWEGANRCFDPPAHALLGNGPLTDANDMTGTPQ